MFSADNVRSWNVSVGNWDEDKTWLPRLISVVMVGGVFWEFTALVPILKIVPTHIHSKRHLVREGMIVEGDRETEFRAIWRRVVTGRKASWRERNRCRKLAGRRRIACKHHAAKENVSPSSQQTEFSGGGGCAVLFWRLPTPLMPGQCTLNQNLWLDVKLFDIYFF